MKRDELFDNMTRIAAALTAHLSPLCEFVVHDLAHPDNSIVYIGGDMTGRHVGGPVTDFVLRLLKENASPDDAVGYMAHTRNGKTLKSSTVFIKDARGRPVGVFCVNMDVSILKAADNQIAELTAPSTRIEVEKSFSPDLPELLGGMIQESLERVMNVKSLDGDHNGLAKAQRQAVLADLETRGALRIRNAVPALADLFKVSRYTIYKDIRSAREKAASVT